MQLQGSFKKGNVVDRISAVKKVAPSPLSPEVLMCKVHWLPETKQTDDEDSNEEFQPLPSLVAISIVKQKCPIKLLEYYEEFYFGKYH